MFFPDISRNDIWQLWHNILTKIWYDKDTLLFENIRDMDHINQKEIYLNQEVDIKKLKDIYLISTPFWFRNLISHLMLEFVFEDEESIVLSVEARRKPWEKFSSKKWLFPHYWLIYIWGTPNDLIWLRKDIRKDITYRYKLIFSQEEKIFWLNYFIQKTNDLIIKPRFYHSLFKNCTTSLWEILKYKKDKKFHFHYSIILSGRIDAYLYSLWIIESKESFIQTQKTAIMN